MNISKTTSVCALTLGLAFVLAAPQARAVNLERKLMVNASGACQSALPVFDGNIRKRPKGVVNEGDAPAFVTCTYYAQGNEVDDNNNPTKVTMYVSTNVLQQTSLTCTGINGSELDNFPASAKTVNLNNPVNTVAITWTPQDFGSFGTFPSPYFSASCQLHPDVAIHNAVIEYIQDVGQ
jgi:hypothetical protein